MKVARRLNECKLLSIAPAARYAAAADSADIDKECNQHDNHADTLDAVIRVNRPGIGKRSQWKKDQSQQRQQKVVVNRCNVVSKNPKQ